MTAGAAVIVNGLDDAVAVLRAARGAPVTLLSAPGAALFAGCLWWREVVRQAHDIVPGSAAADVLDCADASGLALSALRLGQTAIVLYDDAPGHAAVVAIAANLGARVFPAAPPALDLSRRGAARRLDAWLHGS
jgi:hypothetical protein